MIQQDNLDTRLSPTNANMNYKNRVDKELAQVSS